MTQAQRDRALAVIASDLRDVETLSAYGRRARAGHRSHRNAARVLRARLRGGGTVAVRTEAAALVQIPADREPWT